MLPSPCFLQIPFPSETIQPHIIQKKKKKTQYLSPLSGHAEGRVEGVSSSLPLGSLSSLRRLLASLHRRLGGVARALQARASEVGDDADGLRRPVVEVSVVHVLEAGV